MSGSIGKLVDPLGVVIKDKKDSPAPAAAAPPAKEADADKAKTEQMALRQSEASRALSAGAVTDSENESDTLGSTAKRRSASRSLLGG